MRGDVGLPDQMSSFSLGLCVMTKSRYNETYNDRSGFKTIYPLLRFAKKTGWDKFLEINDWKAVRYNEDEDKFELDDSRSAW